MAQIKLNLILAATRGLLLLREMVPPPCALFVDNTGSAVAQSYVAKLASPGEQPNVLATWLTARLSDGAGSCASVKMLDGTVYLVLTDDAVHRWSTRVTTIEQSLLQHLGNPTVEWVRPLTRRLQRLLGWADVASTKEDVARACKAGDIEELKALLPQAHKLIAEEEFEQLPMLHDALQAHKLIAEEEFEQLPMLHDALRGDMPMLMDCQHSFFEEESRFAVQGPCLKDGRHHGPFTRCGSCRVVYCHGCAKDDRFAQEYRKKEQRAVHEVIGHTWPPEPSKKAECTKCGDTPAFVCPCGAQRCGKHLQPPPADPFAPTCVWHQHPTRPLPFYVIDQQKVSDEDKLAWIKQELGMEATLPELAAKFVELFGAKLKDTWAQKSACLKLWGLYAAQGVTCEKGPDGQWRWVPDPKEGVGWKKEVDVPPKLRAEFKRVWDKDSPDICAECGKDMVERGEYCSVACAHAGTKNVCKNCNVELDAAHPYCVTCKRGTPAKPGLLSSARKFKELENAQGSPLKDAPAEERAKVLAKDRERLKIMQSQRDQLSMAQRLWFGGDVKKDDAHQPAWKKKRHS